MNSFTGGPLRLQVGSFPVRDVVFGEATPWSDGVLELNVDQLVAEICRDPRILNAQLHVLRPGERVRLINVRDVIEPRVKVEGPGVCYPGICGRANLTIGEGRTHRLAGVAVAESADTVLYEGNDGWLDRWLDMYGPVAEVAPTGKHGIEITCGSSAPNSPRELGTRHPFLKSCRGG